MTDSQPTNLPESAKEARIVGSKHYFTGKPCPRGHIAARYTTTQSCMPCMADHGRKFIATEEGRESMKASQKKYYHANKESRKANLYRWRVANLERSRELFQRYAKSDKGRATKLWLETVRERALAQARTSWGQEGVAEIYAEARRSGLTVDHIDPIQHPLVCGLHNRFNLQLLSREENGLKGNRWVSQETFHGPGT